MRKIQTEPNLPDRESRRQIREDAGVTGAALAASIGVSQSSVYDWESADSSRDPKGLNRVAYAKALAALDNAASTDA